jgi:predicted GIY-YIG superfamily endonuclease
MSLIQNYGLFWRTENVYWGERGQGNAGRILGYRWGDAQRIVDFSQQVAVYTLCSDYKVLYVGQTGFGTNRLRARLLQHRRDHLAGRWNQFSWFGLRWVREPNNDDALAQPAANVNSPTSNVLDHFEAILIHAAEPPLNRRGGDFGEDVAQYLQFRDEEFLGPIPQLMTKQIWAKTVRPEE